jgi:hypothetical protein
MAIRDKILFPNPLTEQRHMGAPIVNAPGLPMMEAIGRVTTVRRNSLLPTMGTDFAAAPTGENLMTKVQAMSDTPPWSGQGPQKPKADQTAPSSTEGYVRVELHSANGQLSVVGASEVPGPLTIPSAVINGLAYEVLLDDQQIALGSIPDVGLRRAFANRDVPGPEGKHRFIQVPAFDFFVRIPKAHVSDANLPKLTIVLHNVRHAPDRLVPATALQRQSGIETTEVARLSGLSLEKLPPTVRPLFEKALQDNKPERQ